MCMLLSHEVLSLFEREEVAEKDVKDALHGVTDTSMNTQKYALSIHFIPLSLSNSSFLLSILLN